MIPIIKNRKIWFIFSGIMLTISIVSLIVFRFNLGIDFTGGTLLEIEFKNSEVDSNKIKEVLEPLGMGDIAIQTGEENNYLIRTEHINETRHQEVLNIFREQIAISEESTIEEKRFETIGPTIGEELKSKAVTAIVFVLIAIILYIAWAFRKVSGKIPSWKFGVSAIAALTHDIIIVLGIFSVLGYYLDVEISSMFVIALLTVLGYSVNDSIVVFDRIRYNALKGSDGFEETVEKSVNQTLVRSINTSVTTLLVLLVLYLFGGATIQWFVMALICGVIAGTYSSIFVASPILVAWEKRKK
ncbi:MAG: protein translocase subunit SecF [Parcubacteria group bacterium]|nr:protein translocase subunit SecF [Parcubacteria group bacterium]